MRNRFYVAREVLDEPDDGELAWKAIEPIWDSFDLDAELPDLEQSLRELTRGQRALFALDWCHKEVFNGGFEQYFVETRLRFVTRSSFD